MRRTGESIDVRSENPIRVVLAEDHAEFRLGLKEMLSTDEGIEIVGEAENGAQAVALAREVRPDVIVLDLLMRLQPDIDVEDHLRETGSLDLLQGIGDPLRRAQQHRVLGQVFGPSP